jgi:hypothetical protein
MKIIYGEKGRYRLYKKNCSSLFHHFALATWVNLYCARGTADELWHHVRKRKGGLGKQNIVLGKDTDVNRRWMTSLMDKR